MAASSVPVSFNWLWIKRNRNVEVFSDSKHKISCQPHVVSNFDTLTGSDLVFPLARHYFSISSRNFKTCIKACSIMCIANNSSKASCSSSRAVVWSLRSGKPALWPTKRPVINMRSLYWKQSVFLLNSKPWFWIFCQIHNLSCKVSEISICWYFSFLKSINTESFT